MQVWLPPDWTEPAKRLVGQILREPFTARTWAELTFFCVSSVLAVAAALTLAGFGIVGIPLTVVFVGVVVVSGGLRAGRGLGGWQRYLARRALGEELAEPEPFSPQPGLFGWLRACLADWAAWRAGAYFVAKVPLTIFGVWFGLSVWLEALFGIASPLTGGTDATNFGVFDRVLGPGFASSPGLPARIAVFVTGLVLLFVAPWTMRLVVQLDLRLMHLLLGPDAATSRVRSLEVSRSRTLDAATETLRRIERDLHDGTQAQLVALAMRLGQAKEQLDHLDGAQQTADIVAIRRLVDAAHRGAKEAIADLRDLARGIHPPALDMGLENALTTLAARSAVPTEVSVSITTRLGPTLETISYFCVAELLANVAQHAQATRASLSCAQYGPWLRIVVRDNGRGGASIRRAAGGPATPASSSAASSGLAGLAERVAAVDGHLSIASPPGGPTAVTIDLPPPS